MPAPKNLFLESEELRKAHAVLVNSSVFELAVIYALADYASNNPTAEHLIGANRFLDRFIHLSEKDEDREILFAAPRLTPPEQLGREKK